MFSSRMPSGSSVSAPVPSPCPACPNPCASCSRWPLCLSDRDGPSTTPGSGERLYASRLVPHTGCPNPGNRAHAQRHRQLDWLWSRQGRRGRPHERLCPSGDAADLGPGLKGLGPGGSVLGGGAVIAAEVEEIVDPVMGGEEALGLARRLEPLHLPLASSGRLMRVLGSVVEMLWGGGDGMARSPPEATDGAPHGAPHATAE